MIKGDTRSLEYSSYIPIWRVLVSKHVLSLVGLGILSWLLILVVRFTVGHPSRDVNAINSFFAGIRRHLFTRKCGTHRDYSCSDHTP